MLVETIITGVISLIGGGGLACLITLKATNKKANEEAESVAIENDSAVIAQWKEIYENFKTMHDSEMERVKVQYNAAYAELKEKENTLQSKIDEWIARVEERQQKIDEYYNEIQKQRDAKAELSSKLADARVEIEKLESMKCEVRGCKNRKPPSERML